MMEGSERGWSLGTGPLSRWAGSRWMTWCCTTSFSTPCACSSTSTTTTKDPSVIRPPDSLIVQRGRRKWAKKDADGEIVQPEEKEERSCRRRWVTPGAGPWP